MILKLFKRYYIYIIKRNNTETFCLSIKQGSVRLIVQVLSNVLISILYEEL